MENKAIPAIKATAAERKSWENYEKKLILREKTTSKPFCASCANFDFKNNDLKPDDEYFKLMHYVGESPVFEKKDHKRVATEFNYKCQHGHYKSCYVELNEVTPSKAEVKSK